MTESELNQILKHAGMISICRPQVTLLFDKFGQKVVDLIGKPVHKLRKKQMEDLVKGYIIAQRGKKK